MFNGFTRGVPTYSYNSYESPYSPLDNNAKTGQLPIGPQTRLQNDLHNSLLAALYSNIPFVLTPWSNSMGYPGIMGGQFVTGITPDTSTVVEAKDSGYTTDFKTGDSGYTYSDSPQYFPVSNQLAEQRV